MVYDMTLQVAVSKNFEVDSTESVWYMDTDKLRFKRRILKLTPQSQYGIRHDSASGGEQEF